jgi:hypothetical protein
VSDQDMNSDLVEIAKRNGDFRQNYGPWLGALLYWLSIRASRPRSFWWTALVGLLTVAGSLALKYWFPIAAG